MAVSLIRSSSISEIRLEKTSFDLSVIALSPSFLTRRKSAISSSPSTRSLPPIAMATDEGGSARTSRRVSIVCGTNVLSQKYQNYRHLSMSEDENNGGYKVMSDDDVEPAAVTGNEINNNGIITPDGQIPSQSAGDIKRYASFDNTEATFNRHFRQDPKPNLRQQRRGSLPVSTRAATRRRSTLSTEIREEVDIDLANGMATRSNAVSRRRQTPIMLDVNTSKNSVVAVRRQSITGLQPSANLLTTSQNNTNVPRERDNFCKSAPPLINLPRQEPENIRPTHKTFNFIYNDDQQCSEMVDQPIIGGIPTGDDEEAEGVLEVIDGLSDSFPVFSDAGDDVPDEGSFLAPITERALSTTGEESPQDRGLRILRWIMEERDQRSPTDDDNKNRGAKEIHVRRSSGQGKTEAEHREPLSTAKSREIKRSSSRSKLIGKT